MKRKFLTNLILIFILNFTIKTFWMFGIDRTVQNVTGAAEYGMYFSLLSLSILMNILLDLGITNFNNRAVARDHSLIAEHFSKIVPLKFFLAVIYAVVVISTGFILGYSARQFHLLWILVINQFLLSFILYLRSNISGLHLFRTDSFLSVLDRFFVIIICGLLLWTRILKGEFRIEWFAYSQTLAYLLAALIILGIVLGKTGKRKLEFPLKNSLEIIKQSYPFAILILLMSFFNRFDSVLLERMLPDGEIQAGIYAHSFRILDAANMYAVLIAGMLLPIFSRMLKLQQEVGEIIRLSFAIVIIPALTLSVVSLFYSTEIISLLYREHIEVSSRVFKILINGFLFISVSYIFGTLLTANGSLRQLNFIALITVFLNLGLNLLLIPRKAAEGAAIAAVISQSFYAVAQVFVSSGILKLKYDYTYFLRILAYILSLFILSWFIHKMTTSWTTGFFSILLISLLLAWLLKIISLKGIFKIFKLDE